MLDGTQAIVYSGDTFFKDTTERYPYQVEEISLAMNLTKKIFLVSEEEEEEDEDEDED